jgi:hypothetical protein
MRRPALLAAIVAVVAATAVAVVVAAQLVGGDEGPTAIASSHSGAFPEGVFRYRVRKDDVIGVVPDISPAYLADAVGTFTWTVRDGVITLVQTDCACSIPEVSGRYTVAGDRLTVSWPERAANGREFCTGDCVETVRWSYDGAALHVTPLQADGYSVVFWGAGTPWRKVE